MSAPDDQVEVPFQVQREHAGMRVDAFLADRLHRYSRAQVQTLIRGGRVFLRGREAKAAVRVVQGETVLIRYPRRDEPPANHAALPVIHEDEHLLVVNKPADILCHPTDRVVKNTATSILAAQFPKLRLHLIHRLDRETSGVLLLTKTPAAARAMTAQFTRRETAKEYLALAAGRADFSERTVRLPIGREEGEIKVRQTTGRGAAAVTEFVRLDATDAASLILARPKTGRLHQIRVHLASIGHPVLGDKLYHGSGEAYLKAVRKELTASDLRELGAGRQMLHALRLSFRHPASGEAMSLSAPVPRDFLELLRELGLRDPHIL
ncbi:MAG: RluA family pseudouridine synthase [Elusimicrobiota bacterium]|jgi:23S rRNA pseudouridine1911/1915/1917 synthase